MRFARLHHFGPRLFTTVGGRHALLNSRKTKKPLKDLSGGTQWAMSAQHMHTVNKAYHAVFVRLMQFAHN